MLASFAFFLANGFYMHNFGAIRCAEKGFSWMCKTAGTNETTVNTILAAN
jgi:hypothetical protein